MTHDGSNRPRAPAGKSRRRWVRGSARFAGQRRRSRRELLASTALQASATILLAFPAVLPARAQAPLAPTASPQGGKVVAGQASISQNTAQTSVVQGTQRAAVNWTRYDVGSQHTVTYQQPNAQAIILNRVTGPDPSQIAGRIQANGQVVITNQSGVVFQRGAQVDVQSLVVSTAGISNRNFMAGRMVFDRPGRPDARISNEGNISVRDTGLAALVAPQVANSGTITARMGRVVLAGAEAHTVDMYGDGLMSVDVTRDVRRAPNGATALVTNSGTIQADGGTIVLTARAADGIMQNLVSSKGRLQANTVGDKPGTLVVAAVGGSVTIEGAVQADGRAPGTAGGTVQLAATDTVAVGPGAWISASGRTVGGTVAVGTTPTRARVQSGGVPDGSARAVTVAEGARISADGRGTGSGGTVALLSTQQTTMAGRISARGGRRGGDGGQVEISGRTGFNITGKVDTRAPRGRTGMLTIDPDLLNIGDNVTTGNPATPAPDGSDQPAGGTQNISAATFNAFASNVTLTANATINLAGGTPLSAGSTASPAPGTPLTVSLTAPTINVNVSLTQSNAITLAGSTAINLGAPVTATGSTLTLNGGTVTQTAGGTITAGTLTGTLTGAAALVAAQNAVGTLGAFSTGSGFALDNRSAALTVNGVVSAGSGTVALRASDLTVGTLASPLGALLQAPRVELLADTLAVSGIGRAGIGSTGTLIVAPSGDRLLQVGGAPPGSGTTPLLVDPSTLLALLPSGPAGQSRTLQLGSTLGSTVFGDSTTATGVSLQAPLDVASLNQAATLGLYTTGAITQASTAGVTSDTLVGRADGGATFDATTLGVQGNNVANLDTFTTGTSDLTFRDGRAGSTLTIPAGAAVTGAAVTISSEGALAVNGGVQTSTSATLTGTSLSQGNVNSLVSGPSVTFNGPFSQSAGRLVGTTVSFPNGLFQTGGTIWSGNSLTIGVSQVGGTIASAGNVILTGVGSVGGTVRSNGAVSISTNGGTALTLSGTVTARGNVSVTQGTPGTAGAGGGITQSAGAISAGGTVLIYAADGGASQTGGTVAGQQVLVTALAGANTFTPSTQATLTGTVGAPAFSGTADPGSPGALTAAASATRPTLVRLDGDTLTLGRAVAGDTVELHSTGGTNVTGVVGAGTLTGTAGFARSGFDGDNLPTYAETTRTAAVVGGAGFSASNLVDALGRYAVHDGFSLTNGQALTVTGPMTSKTAAITATSMTVTGDIGACAVGGGNGSIALAASTPGTGTILVQSGTVGGEASVSFSAPGGTTVSGGTVNAPSVTGTAGNLAVTGGTVFGDTVAVAGSTSQSGGQLHATTQNAGTVAFSGGDLYAGNDLAISVPASLPGGTAATAGNLTVAAPGGLDTGASLLAGGTNTLNVTGSFTKSGGTIGAGTNLSVLASGTAGQSAGAMLAGGTLLLRATGAGSPTLAGTLSAATVQLVEPAATLTIGSTTVLGAATVSVGPLANTFHCPGCDTNPASSAYTLTASAGAGRPTALRLDGNTLAINGPLSAAAVELHSAGNTSQIGTTAVITADTLTGTAGIAPVVPASPGLPTYPGAAGAGSALLTGASNAIGTLASYTTGSGFALDNRGVPLTVTGTVAGGTGSVSLRAADLTVSGAGGAKLNSATRVEIQADALTVSARGDGTGITTLGAAGVLAVAPSTSRQMTIGSGGSGLNVSPSTLLTLLPNAPPVAAAVELGGVQATLDGTLVAASTTASGLDIRAPLLLNGRAGSLALYTTGSVTEPAGGAVAVPLMLGAAGGSFTLDAPSVAGTTFYNTTYANGIAQLGPVTAGGTGQSVSVASATALAAAGTISAPGGSVTLTSSGTLSLGPAGGITTGATGSVTLQSTTGITQDLAAAAAITTGTLFGQVTDGLAGTTAGRDATLGNAANLIGTLGRFLAGYEPTPGAAPLRVNAQGNLSLTSSQALAVSGPVVAKAVGITAASMTVNGDIGACVVGGAGGTVALTASNGGIAVQSGTVGGQASVTLSALNAAGGVQVSGGTLNSGTAITDGTITLAGGTNLTLTGGQVLADRINGVGTVTQNGGTLSLNVQPTNFTFNGGSLLSTGPLALGLTGIAAGSTISGSQVTITDTAGANTTFTSAGTVLASGDVRFVLPGAGQGFSQTGGTIAAVGTVSVAGSADGLTPLTGAISQSGGLIGANGTVRLYANPSGAPAAAIAGTLSAPTVQVVQPGASVAFQPAAVQGGVTLTLGGTRTYHCPGCDSNVAAVTTGSAASLLGTAPAAVRLDGQTLALGSPFGAGTTAVELHSANGTSQTAGFTAGTLLGTAGYLPSVAGGALPTYGTLGTTGNGVALLSTNNVIGSLGPYYASGSIQIGSSSAMAVRDQVVADGSAGGNATIALTAPTLTVDGSGASRGLLQFGNVGAGGAFLTSVRPVTPGSATVTAPPAPNATTYERVALTTDQLFLTGAGTLVNANGGAVSVVPTVSGTAVTIGPDHALSPWIVGPELARIDALGVAGGPRLVRLGSLDGTTLTAGTITVAGTLALTNSAATLGLYSSGSITETAAGGIRIGRAGGTPVAGTVTGTAAGAVALDAATGGVPNNRFDVLGGPAVAGGAGGFLAGAGLSVSNTADADAGRIGLVAQGTVSSGTGDMSLLSVGQVVGGVRLGGAIAVGGTVAGVGGDASLNAAGRTLTLTARDGAAGTAAVTETAGSSIVAATLTGHAETADASATNYDVLLNAGAANQVGTLGNFTVGPESTSGGQTLVSVQGAFRLADSLGLAVTGLVTAKSVGITANSMTVTGDIGACTVGGAGGDVTLAAQTGALALSGRIGGQTTVALTAPGGAAVTGGLVNAGTTLSVGTQLTVSGGQVFADEISVGGGSGGITQSGGLLHANTLAPGAVTFSGGDLYAGNLGPGLALTVPASLPGGTAATRGNLTVNSSGGLSTGATLVAGGSVGISAGGNFGQTGGLIAAGSGVGIDGTGTIGQAPAGTILAGSLIRLRATGSGSTSLLGTLSADQVAVVQPAASVTAAPSTLGGAAAVTVGTLANTTHCPGCDTNAAASTYLLTATPGAGTPALLRVDGQAISLGTVAAGTVELHSIGDTAGTGAITATLLTGSAGYAGSPLNLAGSGLPTYAFMAGTAGAGSATFANAGNNIQRLGDYQARSGFTLVDAPNQANGAGLVIAGTVRAGLASDPLSLPLANGAPLSITLNGAQGNLRVGLSPAQGSSAAATGSVLAGSTVSLTLPGAVTEEAGSRIVANVLTGSAASVSLPGANAVGAVGGFTAPGGFLLSDGTNALSITGPLNAGMGTVTLTAASVSQTAAGVVTAGTLTGSTSETTDLTAAANQVATLGSYTAGGDFRLNDARGLTVTGAVQAGATLALRVGGDLGIDPGSLTAPTVSLDVPGATTERNGGTITAGLLTGSSGGATSLTSTNAVATVGPYSSGGNFTLNDGGNALQVVGALNAGGNTVALTAGSVSQTAAGVVTAGQLTGSTTGDTDLTAAVNAVATVGPYSTGGDFRVNDGTNALQVVGALNAGGHIVALTAGSLTQTAAGVVTAGLLTGSTSGTTDLTAAANQVAMLGSYTAGGDFRLNDARGLTVTGAVQAGPVVAGRTLALTIVGDLNIDPGSLTAGTVALDVSGTTTERNGGTITADLLTGRSGAATSLGSANTVATVGPYASGGNFTLNDGANALQAVGALNAGGNTVALTAGSVSQTAAGVVTAGQLTGSTTGDTDLTAAANQVATLGSYATGGNFTLNDARGLTVTGAVQAGPTPPAAAGRTLTLTVAGDLAIDPGSLTAQMVVLNAAGALAERNGATIRAGLLTGSSGAATGLTSANAVATVGPYASGGDFTLNDGTNALQVVGALNAGGNTINLTAGSVSQTAAGVVTAGTLTGSTAGTTDLTAAVNAVATVGPYATGGDFRLNDGAGALRIVGALNAGANTVALTAGSVSQMAAGVVTAGTLTGSTSGTTDLTAAANQVATLGSYTAGGDFRLNDARGLTVTGAVQAGPVPPAAGGTTLALTVAGDLGIDPGSLTAGTVALNVTGATTERNGGTITAGLLTGTSGGATSLASANEVATVGPYASGGDFTLNDGPNALRIVDALNAGGNTVNVTAGSLTQSAAGVVTAGTLTGSTRGVTDLSTAVNAVGTVGPYATGGDFRLNDGGNVLQVVGVLNAGGNTVALTAGSVSQTAAGAVTAGTLTGSTSGTTDLSTAANQVATLGSYTAGGDFRLNDARGLTVAGAVQAGPTPPAADGRTLALTVAGDLNIDPGSLTAGTVALDVSGALAERNGGAITAGSLAVSAAQLDLGNPGNRIGTLAAISSTNGLTILSQDSITTTGPVVAGNGPLLLRTGGNLETQGRVSASGGVTLQAAGTFLDRTGSAISGASVSTSSGGATTVSGTIDAPGAVTVNANGVVVTGSVNGNPVGIDAGPGMLTLALGSSVGGSSLTAQAGGQATLAGSAAVGGGLTVTASAIQVPGTLSGDAVRLASGNALGVASTGRVTGNTFTASSGGETSVAGTVSFTGPVDVASNGLTVTGSVGSSAAVTLDAGTGGITEAASGSVTGRSVTTRSNGLASLAGAVTATGGATSITAGGIEVSGQVNGTAGEVTLSAGGGALTQTGTGRIRAGNLVASSGVSVSQAQGGLIEAGTTALITSGGDAVLAGSTAAGTQVTVTAGALAALAGSTVAAPRVVVAAPTVRISGGTLLVGGVPQPSGTLFAALPTADGTAGGAYFRAGTSFVQTGTTVVRPLAGASVTTIRVDLRSGLASFGTLDTRVSPSDSVAVGNLILNLGTGSATASQLFLANLTVAYTDTGIGGFGPGGTELNATVGTQGGTGAAGASQIAPRPSQNYRVNGCPIQSVNCVVFSAQPVPIGNPLKELSLNFFREQDDDTELLVPNISDQGL